MKLYAHPFSSYSQKALIAFYEKDIPFEFALLSPDYPRTQAEHLALWPLGRFPVLEHEGHVLFEASIIVEYLDQQKPDPLRLVAESPSAALEVRMLDRIFDNYVMTPVQTIVSDSLRPPESRDPHGVARARALLDSSYAWIDQTLQGREWAAGGAFSLADCAAAPSLFYADWVHAIGDDFADLRAYRARLLSRPSVARAVDEARPYRKLFPLGAPDRD